MPEEDPLVAPPDAPVPVPPSSFSIANTIARATSLT